MTLKPNIVDLRDRLSQIEEADPTKAAELDMQARKAALTEAVRLSGRKSRHNAALTVEAAEAFYCFLTDRPQKSNDIVRGI